MKEVAVTRKNFGAWVIKCNPHVWDFQKMVIERGDLEITGWTLGDSYRLDLMRPGQPVVFWLSGSKDGDVVFRGVWGIGKITSGVMETRGFTSDKDAKANGWIDVVHASKPKFFVETDIPLLENPIRAEEYKSDPILAKSEPIRVPQLSNPAFLTKEEFRALQILRKTNSAAGAIQDAQVTISKSGAGFGTAEQNKETEIAGMSAAKKYYEKLDFKVEDVSKYNFGWDIVATPKSGKRGAKLIEVKGVRGSEPRILLTRNEYNHAQVEGNWELAVVTNALSKPKVNIFNSKDVIKNAEVLTWQVDLR